MSGTRESDRLSAEYEKLRKSALGQMQQASGMALFLRQGMARWLQAVGKPAVNPGHCAKPRCTLHEPTRDRVGLAGILADAIIDTAGPTSAEVRR
jgi:hypothetical protein